VEEWKKARGLQ